MLIIILATAILALLFYYKMVKPMSYWKERGVKQGKPLWIVGDNWGMVSSTKSFPELVQYVYSMVPGTRYTGSYQFSVPTLVLRDPELIKQITVKDFEHFTDHRRLVPPDADPLFGNNLFALQGAHWRDMRNILSPSFTSSKMRSMFVLMRECSENFVQHFLKKDEEIVTLEIKDAFTRYTNDVIATSAFGVKVDSLENPNNEFYLMGKEATNFTRFSQRLKFFGYFLIPSVLKFFKISLLTHEARTFFRSLIHETIKTREEKGIVRQDMIHLLMEAKKGNQSHEENSTIDTGFATALETDAGKAPQREITNDDITAQALIFFFAGFESVAALMSFSAYELAVNQDIQERLRTEIEDTIKENGGKVTYEGLLKMKYMDMFISESLRKWPAAVAVDRVCTKPYTVLPATPEEKPLYLEKGTILWLPIYAMHHDPEHYPDPEKFDPERFSDENKGNIKPYTYFPFGLGPRNCIGSRFALLEAKTVLFYILMHFEIVPVEKTRIPLKFNKKALNLQAEGGFWFGLKRIKK